MRAHSYGRSLFLVCFNRNEQLLACILVSFSLPPDQKGLYQRPEVTEQICSAAESRRHRQTPPHLPELQTLWHLKRPLLNTHFFPPPLLSPYKYLVILTVTVPVEQRCLHSLILVL